METDLKSQNYYIKKCIYCEGIEDITWDHIPPKALFPEPRPSTLLTVPCCKKCNSSFSKDDEYFRTLMVSCASVYDDPNVQSVNAKLLRSIKRPEASKMSFALYKSLHIVDLKSPGGIYLGKSPAIKVNTQRLNNVITRIAKGLYYIVCGCPVRKDYEIKCIFKDGTFSISEDFINYGKGFWQQPITIGNNVFSYSYAKCSDDPNSMLFIYWLYDKLYFFGWVISNKKIKTSQELDNI